MCVNLLIKSAGVHEINRANNLKPLSAEAVTFDIYHMDTAVQREDMSDESDAQTEADKESTGANDVEQVCCVVILIFL